jgi:hypothetical protein
VAGAPDAAGDRPRPPRAQERQAVQDAALDIGRESRAGGEWRELDEAEGRAAGEAFRDAHPIYSRMVLRMLARLNGLEGDLFEAVVRNLPMLGLRRVGS